MELRIATIAERPGMKSTFTDADADPWPAFMGEDPLASLFYSVNRITHPEYGLIAYDASAPDQAIARAFCASFAWDGDPALGELPADGWDGVIWRSARDRQAGRKPNLVSALEITIRTDLQGTGLSAKMLAAMRDNAARLGFEREWRSWTGLPFDKPGPVAVPGALVPVQCSVEHDYAVYVEPAVWVHHQL
ncbi:MAG: hypothetical protein J2P25_09675 [Nocardiopsaceae bacterium]|nr:hypothetical protein [Nocardiopsaceae bacterium]